jgi:ATP-dependent Clp protease ATP-binding subunit ClpA
VGKTELAKAIAELVFGDEGAILRFDMSEFQDEHAKVRLTGAPPGYVGFGDGGELTNAIQQHPHSVVLFDEMDKAGSQVWGLFLQILSDGRLTDGSGNTASFSEALIVFTSNKGVDANSPVFALDMSDPTQVARYEQAILKANRDFFELDENAGGLGRPELLGRFGDNIIVFRPIQGAVARQLADRFIRSVIANVEVRVGNTVIVTPDALEQLITAMTSPEVLTKGARGITKALETFFTNPLGRELFTRNKGTTLTVTGVSIGANGNPSLRFASQ